MSKLLQSLLLPVVAASSCFSSEVMPFRGHCVADSIWAVAYSGFREGQHPDRGAGAINPSDSEIVEDLLLLVQHGFSLVRMYDAGENTARTLSLIENHGLPMRVLLGAWLDAEISNHEGCPWLDTPIPEEQLAANRRKNDEEVQTAIRLANQYPAIVCAINVGNEALVSWNDHMMSVERVIELVRRVKSGISQPVTVAENYEWWAMHGKELAQELDFIGVHTYPVWEGKSIDEAMPYTLENIARVHAALPDAPIAILEAGWATTASEFPELAGESQQTRYYRELKQWALDTGTSVFFFEAFDEPWKGDPGNPLGAEKHWGLFFEDRTPKQVMLQPGL
jgi:exo-beta-1,3-glucanase (GH17 family)